MNRDDAIDALKSAEAMAMPGSSEREAGDLLDGLLHRPLSSACAGAVIGRLVALVDQGRTPLVTYDGMPGHAALRASSTVELDGRHVGRLVVLIFERDDPARPVVLGRLRQDDVQVPAVNDNDSVQVDTDGEQLIVSAKGRLVLRCGRSSIVLHADGRISLRGDTIVSQAIAANHVRGGSVQLN